MAHEIVTQTEIDSLLRNANLPPDEPEIDETPTTPAPPFSAGFEPYEGFFDARGYLRAPLPVASSLLAIPLR